MPEISLACEPADRAAHCQAVTLLNEGRVREGVALLGEIARRTRDHLLASQCLFNLGEVLEQLGDVTRAYETWYVLAHKPHARRNEYDRQARTRVMRMFDAGGLHFKPPDFPPRVQIEITNRCNLRCIMCTRNQMTREQGDVTVETFERVAREVCAEPDCVLAMYFLGEPLLHRRLEDLVRCVTRRSRPGFVFGIQTNGMLLDEGRARGLLEAGLRNFAFSVDGLEGDLERIRPGARYPVVEENILRLLRIAGEMGLEDVRVDISKLCENPAADEVRRFRGRWEGKVHAVHLLGITRVQGNSYLGADGIVHEAAPAPAARGYCGQGQRLLVHWNGDYAFCCSDINRRIDLGSVEQASIRETWNSDRMEDLRRRVFAGVYIGLPACLECRAGCR
jgi:hypothetical protein